mgnify:FL=1|jgi:hypothetical protein
MTTREKMKYLEKKFNPPMDIIMQVIRFCEKEDIDITQIEMHESNDTTENE